MVVISVCIYGVEIIKNSSVKVVFFKGGSMEPTLRTNRSARYLMQLSVKVLALSDFGEHAGLQA